MKTIILFFAISFSIFSQNISITTAARTGNTYNWTADFVTKSITQSTLTLTGNSHFAKNGSGSKAVHKYIRYWVGALGAVDSVEANAISFDFTELEGDSLFYDCTTLQPNGRWTNSPDSLYYTSINSPAVLQLYITDGDSILGTFVDYSNVEDGFIIQRGYATGVLADYDTTIINSFIDDSVTAGIRYFYDVCSYKIDGTRSLYTNEANILVPFTEIPQISFTPISWTATIDSTSQRP